MTFIFPQFSTNSGRQSMLESNLELGKNDFLTREHSLTAYGEV